MKAREIKFRAWSPCEWQDNEPTKWYMSVQENSTTDALFRFSGGLYRESILMQFTGLLDRHGKEIYEGDILKMMVYRQYNESGRMEEHISEVFFSGAAFWWKSKFMTDCNWHFYNARNREIIGNIYENPELL